MPKFNFVLLYVTDPLASADFYSKLLGRPPVEASSTFAMINLHDDVMLGLWLRKDVQPRPIASPGGSEIAFVVADADEVRATHRRWTEQRLGIVQPPTEMDFGHTFVALDPDGNRLRVFARKGASSVRTDDGNRRHPDRPAQEALRRYA